MNILGAAVKSQMDSFGFLKSWLEYEKNCTEKQKLKQKGSDCKGTGYCVSVDGQQLSTGTHLAHGQ